MLRALAAAHKPKLAFIGVGGVMDADGVRAKLDAGADLVQAYTGFIYAGPGFARACLAPLVDAPQALPA
jgi:dihydroorotate dehydrogenase